jgi:hypothetical protein
MLSCRYISSTQLNPSWYITAKRFQYLYKLYEQAGGNASIVCRQYASGKEIGFDTELTDFVVADLRDKGLARFSQQDRGDPSDFDLKISITEKGIEEVRSAVQKPHSPTQHFPVQAIKFAKPETKANSNLVVKEIGIVSDSALTESILTLVIKKIAANMEQFNLRPDEKKELLAEIQTLECQLSSPRPKAKIIACALASAKSILENEIKMSAPAFVIIHNIASALHSLF